MANKAGKKHIVYQTTEQVQFSAPIKTETGSIHLSAGADAWQDDKFVYLKLNTFGAVSEHLLRQPGKSFPDPCKLQSQAHFWDGWTCRVIKLA